MFLSQLPILATKRALLCIRNYKTTLAQILVPILIVLMLYCFQLLSNLILGKEEPNPPIVPMNTLSPCYMPNGAQCDTILYCPPNVWWVDEILTRVASKNNLNFKEHFKPFNQSLFSWWCIANTAFQYYIHDHQNITQNAIFFHSAFPLMPNSSMPSDPGFFIYYNSTNKNHDYIKELTKSLNEAIAEVKAALAVGRGGGGGGSGSEGSTMSQALSSTLNFSVELSTIDYPNKYRIAVFDVVAANGATWFFLPPMITFFLVFTEIVFEKEKRLRIGMRMMGLSNAAYWTVWWLAGVVLSSLSCLVLIAAGAAAQFAFFLNANQFCIFLMFFFFSVGITSFAMFLSTMVSKSETAQTVGYALVLCGFVFQIILSSGEGILIRLLWTPTAPDWVVFLRWLLTFYPPFNMAKVFGDIANKASDTINLVEGRVVSGSGFFWSDLWVKSNITFSNINVEVPAPAETFGWLCVSAFVYILLMWYLDNVLPGEHGSPKPPYFFLLPRYWMCCASSSPERNNTGSVAFIVPNSPQNTDDVINEQMKAQSSSCSSPLKIISISKVYRKYPIVKSRKDVTAVRSLSLTGEEGAILCLLGHNGAGKTTLVNMLTGLFKPTRGTALIYQKDINEEIDQIREFMGVCPQHDILWPELTAREHLLLFARLKGFRGRKAIEETDNILRDISLFDVGDDRVSSFSGGMKRRLSVGISTIGDPKIIFMDEPTTGLDPVNKRNVWHMIQQLKQNRVIILTTHSMEEADVLSDKVAIMANGELKCVGSSLYLKNRFGTGYRINIITTDSETLTSIMKRRWPDLNLEENEAGSLQFTIPLTSQEIVPEILNYLETNEENLVDEWGLSHATLEEVFLQVTKKSNFKYDEIDQKDGNEEDPAIIEQGQDEEMVHQHLIDNDLKRNSYPLRALFRKNMKLQSRQKCTNVCQVLTPVLVVVILVILQAVLRAQLGDNYNVPILQPSLGFPLNSPGAFDLWLNGTLHMDPDDNKLIYHCFPAPRSQPLPLNGDCLMYFRYTDNGNPQVGTKDDMGNSTGILGQIVQNECFQSNISTAVPYFEKRQDQQTINEEIWETINKLDNIAIESVTKPPYDKLLPDGYVIFDSANASLSTLSATISINTNTMAPYHRKNNFTRVDWKIPKGYFLGTINLAILQGWAQMVDLVVRAFTNYTLQFHNLPSLTPPSKAFESARMVITMPYDAVNPATNILEILGSFLYPIAMSMQLPVYAFLLVLEKKTKLRQMMKTHGLKVWHYLFVNYLFFFVLYALSVIFFWFSGIGVQLRFFTQTNVVVLLLFFVGWGVALISLAFLISAFLSDPRAATVVGYAISLMGTLTTIAIAVGIYGPFNFSIQPVMPQGLLVWPQFGFTRGIFLMNDACTSSYSCYRLSQLIPQDELFGCVLSLYLCGIVYFLFYCYLDAVLPQEFGVPKHPLFFLFPVMKFLGVGKFRAAHQLADDERGLLEVQEDNDVAALREAVSKNQYVISDDPLIIKELRKCYDDGKVAVHNLSLLVKKNSCFGLLGENGAGKTTTISMLTGLFPPTKGTAFVGGYDITREIDMVHLVIGFCPQFDILWDDLTCKEHLLFYARLKGIPPNEEDSHVKQILHEVGLYDARNRFAIKLSGGMRRRLSLAISFVGRSRITFLDEPTTGLDPASRRHIWTIIARAKRNRAIVLTTHSMDEAETLCNVIGILAHGVLRCVGSSQHLKSVHGEGYILTLAYDYHDKKTVTRFVKKLIPNAIRVSRFKGTDQYKILRGEAKVSDIFSAMEHESQDQRIKDWSISQVGLEDIFQSIVKKSQEQHDLSYSNRTERHRKTSNPTLTTSARTTSKFYSNFEKQPLLES